MDLPTLNWISIRSGATVYYFKHYIGNYDPLTSWFLVTEVAATFARAFCLAPLTRLFRGKRNTFAALTTIVSATALLFHLVTPVLIPLLFAIEVVASFFSGPFLPLFWSLIVDTADYGEWKFDPRSTGLVFSDGTFFQKAGWTIGEAVSAALLGVYGFIANAEPSAATVSGIKAFMGAIPSTVGFLTIVFFHKEQPLPQWCGLTLDYETVGATDATVLTRLIETNERGLTTTTLAQAFSWQDGTTLRRHVSKNLIALARSR